MSTSRMLTSTLIVRLICYSPPAAPVLERLTGPACLLRDRRLAALREHAEIVRDVIADERSEYRERQRASLKRVGVLISVRAWISVWRGRCKRIRAGCAEAGSGESMRSGVQNHESIEHPADEQRDHDEADVRVGSVEAPFGGGLEASVFETHPAKYRPAAGAGEQRTERLLATCEEDEHERADDREESDACPEPPRLQRLAADEAAGAPVESPDDEGCDQNRRDEPRVHGCRASTELAIRSFRARQMRRRGRRRVPGHLAGVRAARERARHPPRDLRTARCRARSTRPGLRAAARECPARRSVLRA